MAEKLDQHDTDQGPQTVDDYVCFGGAAAGYKGLMEFICAGEGHAEKSGKDKQPEPS